jgi:cysteinyl-tRNA synthetase
LSIFGLEPAAADEAPPAVLELADRRQKARERREFEEADRLRDEIASAGWEIQDVADGFRLIPLT